MILLALLVPALMMALLFGMDALENLLFPRSAAAGDGAPTDRLRLAETSVAHPDEVGVPGRPHTR